jgi:hypothetical protein
MCGDKKKVDPATWFGKCLGPTPPACPLRSEVVREGQVGPWTGQWLRFHSEPGEWVTAVLVRPEGVERPPVVICHPGHGADKECEVFGRDWPDSTLDQDPVAALVRSGIAVLGVDARCHGERLGTGAPDRKSQPQDWHRYFDNEWAWLTRRGLIDGRSLQGLLVHDVRRAIDYLESRDDIDATRVGMYGYSLGGTTCWSATLVEPRIKVAVVGGCLITYEAALRVRRDASWHAWVAGVRQHATRPQLISAIAPRPLLAIHGEDDFPSDGTEPIIDAARTAYAQAGVPQSFRPVFLPGDHTAAACHPDLFRELEKWFLLHL